MAERGRAGRLIEERSRLLDGQPHHKEVEHQEHKNNDGDTPPGVLGRQKPAEPYQGWVEPMPAEGAAPRRNGHAPKAVRAAHGIG
jgi:hypothetical protein